MRKTISRFTSSFAALLTDQTTVIDADGRTENIRTAMLQDARCQAHWVEIVSTDQDYIRPVAKTGVGIQTAVHHTDDRRPL